MQAIGIFWWIKRKFTCCLGRELKRVENILIKHGPSLQARLVFLLLILDECLKKITVLCEEALAIYRFSFNNVLVRDLLSAYWCKRGKRKLKYVYKCDTFTQQILMKGENAYEKTICNANNQICAFGSWRSSCTWMLDLHG